MILAIILVTICMYIYTKLMRNTNNQKRIAIIIASFLMFFISSNVYAKYIVTGNFNVKISSLPFYFVSEVSSTHVVLSDNTGQFTITVKNNDGTNYNSFETSYEVYLKDTSLYTINVTDSNSGKIAGGSIKQNTVTINVTPTAGASLKVNETIQVVIKATSPYAKEIIHEVNINKPDAELAFGSLSDFRKIERVDCEGYSDSKGTYDDIYAGNNDKLQYNTDGSLVFDADNPILYMELDDAKSKLFDEAYSMYFTIKANTNQTGDDGYFGGTIASVGNGVNNYKCWISIYKNYLHVYSYLAGGSKSNINKALVETGFISFDISQYSNTIMNIQITATKTGKTKVYINGELKKTFTSGGADILTTHVTIGDLRPLRNLKFQGTIYDFSMYNVELTAEEVKNNYNYAKNKWMN